jgi:hypothetical protein
MFLEWYGGKRNWIDSSEEMIKCLEIISWNVADLRSSIQNWPKEVDEDGTKEEEEYVRIRGIRSGVAVETEEKGKKKKIRGF